MLVLYDYDSNSTHVEPMRKRTSYQILLAYQHALRLLISRSLYPRLQKLDNKCSNAFVHYLEDEHIGYQLPPTPHVIHRCNAAEKEQYEYGKNTSSPSSEVLIPHFR